MANRDIGNLRTRLSWEDEGANKSLTGFKRDLKGLRSEMKVATSRGKEYTRGLKGMREQSDILTRRLKTQKEQVRELKRRYEESVRVKGEDDKQTKNLASQYNNATAEMNKTEAQLKRLNGAIQEQSNPWKKLSKNMDRTGKKMQDIGRGMTDFGRSYSMRVTAPIVAGGVAIFKASMDYETAFAGVRKTVDATEDQFATLSRGIRDMAKEMPQSATEIAGVAEVAGQLGIKQKDILQFTKTMVDMGTATNMSSEDAATALARLANITQMPMENIDRLGATVVDLGNNLATTESEIVEMGLRLAGAGHQVGMSEAQILSFSGALSSVGINAEAGGSAISKLMINMANEVATGGKKLKGFAKTAGMSVDDFKKAFQDDAAGAIVAFTKGLGKIDKQGGNVFGTLEDLGLTEVRLRDAILRLAGSGDVLEDSLKQGNKAWDENVALQNEVEQRYKTSESQLKIMWNRVKDVAITLGDALVPAVMGAIDAAGPLIEKIESGAQAFADMDEEQQQTILKMIALAAAVGPASIALGGMTTTMGGMMRVGGKVVGMLGKAGGKGKGMLGRLGLMGVAGGPVGLAIAGVSALGLTYLALRDNTKESLEATNKAIDKRQDEINSVDETIEAFEKLQKKNKLTTDEVLRYMDIMDELKDAESEETIKSLTKEQEGLLKKSGLTNKEMETFLKLNGDLVEKAPETAKAISEQGNAYAEVTDEIRKLNDEERRRLADDTYIKISDEMEKQRDNLAKQKKLQSEISSLESERSTKNDLIHNKSEDIRSTNLLIADLQNRIKNASKDELPALQEKLNKAQIHKQVTEHELEVDKKSLSNLDAKIKKKSSSLNQTEKELKEFNKLTDKYAQMVLYEAGIVSEKGKANEAVRKEQREIDKARKKLEEMKKSGQGNTSEYNEQNKKLNEQQAKLDAAKKKLQEMNREAGKTIYKDVNVKSTPSAAKLNSDYAQTVYKRIKVTGAGSKNQMLGYATGTDNHPGGPFVAGEEGFELGRMGNRWEWLNTGMYDRPRGYEVFTHDESKKIIRALNRMPGYATGARNNSEANRVVSRLNEPNPMNDNTGQVVSLLRDIARGIREGKIIKIGNREITQVVNERNAFDNLGTYF